MKNIRLDRIMTPDPTTIGPKDSAKTAIELFESSDLHHLPVVENGTLLGIVSSSDLLKLYLLDGGAAAVTDADATVRQIMQVDPVVVDASADLRDVATMFSASGYHALPDVKPDRTLVGIVTTSDLIDHLLEQIPRGDGSIRTVSQAPEHLEERHHLLESTCQAAELYMRSGHGEHEHAVLIKRLAELQESRPKVYL